MIRFFTIVIGLCGASAALAQVAPTGQSPNPAIVRIISPERDGMSFGSGSLVAVNDTYGLVVTNWHVVRDASGPIWVAFPNGFYSIATVLKTDRDWDLAALAIWRPNVQPLPIANQAPALGERLTIAGYGSGSFRTASGQCTQYVSPGGNNPFEMIELSAPARNGDSGGPILNERGEIAGVLFGSSYGQTTGSYCGRLHWFLSLVANDFQRLPQQNTAIAQQPSTPLVPVASISAPSTTVASAANQAKPYYPQSMSPAVARTTDIATASPAIYAAPQSPTITIQPQWQKSPWFDQVRNYLAIIGIAAVFVQGLRIIGKLSS